MRKKEEASRDEGKPTPEVSLQNISVRQANISDIKRLSDLYLGLSYDSRRLFHPFPFNRTKLIMIFLIMTISGNLIGLIRKTLPKLGFLVLVAKENNSTKIDGFTYLSIFDYEKGVKLVANRGIVTREGIRAKGLGTALDSQLIRIARNIGITRFSVTALQDNAGSIALHKKMGYKITGSTVDLWDGKEEKALVLELELS